MNRIQVPLDRRNASFMPYAPLSRSAVLASNVFLTVQGGAVHSYSPASVYGS